MNNTTEIDKTIAMQKTECVDEVVLLYELVGYVAVFMGCFINFPQVYKTYKTKSVESFSITSLILHCFVSIILFIYAYLRNIKPNMVFNSVLGISNMFLIIMYYMWKDKNIKRRNSDLAISNNENIGI